MHLLDDGYACLDKQQEVKSAGKVRSGSGGAEGGWVGAAGPRALGGVDGLGSGGVTNHGTRPLYHDSSRGDGQLLCINDCIATTLLVWSPPPGHQESGGTPLIAVIAFVLAKCRILS